MENSSGNMENGSADDSPIEELIDLIRGKPELWNPSADEYRNTKMKKAAWESVAIGTSRSELWCKAEWTKLRNGFTRKKKQLIGKTGQARKKIESSDYFQLLLFLNEVPNEARTKGNFSKDEDDGSGNSGDEREEVDLDKEDNVESTTVTSPQNESASSATEGMKPNVKTPTYSSSRNRKRPIDPVDKELVDFLKKPKVVEDEHHHFGMGIADQLRKMDPALSMYVKMTVQRVIYECVYPQSMAHQPTG